MYLLWILVRDLEAEKSSGRFIASLGIGLNLAKMALPEKFTCSSAGILLPYALKETCEFVV